MAKASVLIVEDDPEIRELLSFAFAREGWILAMAPDGERGLERLRDFSPDCVVLDIMLPGLDGLEVLRRLKADPERRGVPVIMTTARGEEADVVAGLELGADDYVVKPYSPKVLAARIRAALRRHGEGGLRGGLSPGAAPVTAPGAASVSGSDPDLVRLEHGGLRLDESRHEVWASGLRVELTATEFSILALLMASPGRVYRRSQIIDAVKGPDYPVTDRAVDVQILSLRRKLGGAGGLVETVRGVGYRLRD